MKTTAVFRSITFALGLGLAAGMALAEEPAVAADPAAPASAQPAPPAAPDAPEAGKTRVFSMSIDTESEDDAGGGAGIQISLGDDEDHVAVAAKVIGRLEAALENLPAEVQNSQRGDIEELRAAMEDLRDLKSATEVHEEVRVHQDEGFLEQLVPIVALLVIFGGPVLIVAIVSRNNRRKREMVHQTIDRMIAQGKDVPVELLDALDKGGNGKSGLARGTVNVALGLGIGGMFLANAGVGAASIGLIPLAIGLAQLLVWKLESPRPN